MADDGVVRALAGVWRRKVAHLPDSGVLLVATDLQGNLGDFHRMVEVYYAEKAAGNQPILAFCGDLVHGPSGEMNAPGAWPPHLGTPYVDQSADVLLELEALTRTERVFSLMGNHEHAHVGGPVVAKFFDDEAAMLDRRLGDHRGRLHAFLRTFPLVAISPGGLALTHAAPAATESHADAFEELHYSGYQHLSLWAMAEYDTLGALLWMRGCDDSEALDLLEVLTGARQGVVIWGHEIARDGFNKARHHICVSTSFGLVDRKKTYVRADLAATYASTADLRVGIELLPLYPG